MLLKAALADDLVVRMPFLRHIWWPSCLCWAKCSKCHSVRAGEHQKATQDHDLGAACFLWLAWITVARLLHLQSSTLLSCPRSRPPPPPPPPLYHDYHHLLMLLLPRQSSSLLVFVDDGWRWYQMGTPLLITGFQDRHYCRFQHQYQ